MLLQMNLFKLRFLSYILVHERFYRNSSHFWDALSTEYPQLTREGDTASILISGRWKTGFMLPYSFANMNGQKSHTTKRWIFQLQQYPKIQPFTIKLNKQIVLLSSLSDLSYF